MFKTDSDNFTNQLIYKINAKFNTDLKTTMWHEKKLIIK